MAYHIKTLRSQNEEKIWKLQGTWAMSLENSGPSEE